MTMKSTLRNALQTTVLSFMLLTALQASAQDWQIDGAHTNVLFSVDHMMVSETTGRFKKVEGSVKASKPDFTDAVVDIKIPISSVDTDNADRDKHLQAEDFFDAAKFPHMSFKSTKISKESGNTYAVSGNLTIHGVTKPVTLKGRFIAPQKDPYGKTRAGFAKLEGKINRQDFGVSGGGMAVGDEVRITVNVEVVQ